MGKLPVAGSRFSTLTIGNNVIDRAVLERVNFIPAYASKLLFCMQINKPKKDGPQQLKSKAHREVTECGPTARRDSARSA